MQVPASLIIELGNHKLWLGSLQNAQDKNWLFKENIKCVITTAIGQPVTYHTPDIQHYEFAIEDKPQFNLSIFFNKVNKLISKHLQQSSVLVHCAAGISRSAACVIAYLMSIQKLTFKQSYIFVKERRQIIKPNDGFIQQLRMYGC